MAISEGMVEYTKWCVKYPWHVSDEPVPDDCGCEYCAKERTKNQVKTVEERR